MAKISRIVLDVLKPTEELASSVLVTKLADVNGINSVDLNVIEVDKKVETVVLTIEGLDIDLEKVRTVIEKSGASLHSIDRIKAKE